MHRMKRQIDILGFDSEVDPLSCMVHDILQEMLEVGKSPSTLRGMVATIKAVLGNWKRVVGRQVGPSRCACTFHAGTCYLIGLITRCPSI